MGQLGHGLVFNISCSIDKGLPKAYVALIGVAFNRIPALDHGSGIRLRFVSLTRYSVVRANRPGPNVLFLAKPGILTRGKRLGI